MSSGRPGQVNLTQNVTNWCQTSKYLKLGPVAESLLVVTVVCRTAVILLSCWKHSCFCSMLTWEMFTAEENLLFHHIPKLLYWTDLVTEGPWRTVDSPSWSRNQFEIIGVQHPAGSGHEEMVQCGPTGVEMASNNTQQGWGAQNGPRRCSPIITPARSGKSRSIRSGQNSCWIQLEPQSISRHETSVFIDL